MFGADRSRQKRVLAPLLGFGTFNQFTNNDQVADAVKTAIKAGYRHFDLAVLYDNEREVGQALRDCISEGIVNREDIYVCTKLWNSEHHPNDVEPAIRASLERCGLDYFDNFTMHWPTQWKKNWSKKTTESGTEYTYETIHVCDATKVSATWSAMEELVHKGLARSLGVSNFDEQRLIDLLDRCEIRPTTNQVEMHPYLGQRGLLAMCKEEGIQVVAYCPLGKPGYKKEEEPSLIEDPIIVDIAKKIDKTPAQVVLRWGVQRGACVIPKSFTPERILENANILQWQLDNKEMKLLDTLDRGHRFVKVPWFDFTLYDNVPRPPVAVFNQLTPSHSHCAIATGIPTVGSGLSLAKLIEPPEEGQVPSVAGSEPSVRSRAGSDPAGPGAAVGRSRGGSNPAPYYPEANVVALPDGSYTLGQDASNLRGLKRSESSLSSSGNLAAAGGDPLAHPDIPTQPILKLGICDETGVYHNEFGRAGKDLNSHIYLKSGILRNIEFHIRRILPANSLTVRNYILTDEIVNEKLDLDNTFMPGCKRAGVEVIKIVVEADSSDASGETSTEPYKTSDVFHRTVEEILSHKITKHSCIISIGGGVINNMAGVIAGTLYRGIGLVHFTTTSMGMLDAALDFKQAINHNFGKNLLGCYYPASCVVIDPECLTNLSTRHIRNGIGEALKHALCQSKDMVAAIVDPVKEQGEEKFKDVSYMEDVCKMCIEIKSPTLDFYHDSDFNEMCPQYGHAVAHAIESLSWNDGHEALLHGEAVAIGMCVSAEIALKRGYCDEATVHSHYDACLTLGLPAYIPVTMATEHIIKKLYYDKHFLRKPCMGLVSSIGNMACESDPGQPSGKTFTFAVELDELESAVAANLERAARICAPCI